MDLLDRIKKDYNLGTDDIINTLEMYGVCLVKNLITQEMLAPILLEIRHFMDIIKMLLKERGSFNKQKLDIFFAKIIAKHPNLQPIIYDRLGQLLSLHAFPSNERIISFSKALLETDKIGLWPRIQLRLDTYHDQENLIRWHHDYFYNKGTEHSYTFWIPITPIDESMGLLKFIPGSHKNHYEFQQKVHRGHGFDLENQPDNKEVFKFNNYSPGDALIFHSKLVHSGQLNTDLERARMVILFRMQNLEKLEDFQR